VFNHELVFDISEKRKYTTLRKEPMLDTSNFISNDRFSSVLLALLWMVMRAS